MIQAASSAMLVLLLFMLLLLVLMLFMMLLCSQSMCYGCEAAETSAPRRSERLNGCAAAVAAAAAASHATVAAATGCQPRCLVKASIVSNLPAPPHLIDLGVFFRQATSMLIASW
jgi:Na+-transporting methylmalonyl-CoA/oxaloacetate decarboxylase gamma subunit